MTEVKPYTDKQLLDRVKNLPTFQSIPKGYWLLGAQSNEKTFNVFADKVYLFKGEEFIDSTTATTRAGSDALLSFDKIGLAGAFVWETDKWFYDVWCSLNWDMKTKYLHKGKMKALRQHKPITGYRDNNKNKLTEKTGKKVEGTFGCNFHTNTYKTSLFGKVKNWLIGAWSYGCIVSNDPEKYYGSFIPKVYEQTFTSFCLIEEF